MKHQLDINLDDVNESETFVNKHGTLKGRGLSNAIGLHGEGAVKLANSLSGYAWNKVTAATCRRKGKIQIALNYERICDDIYNRLIQPYCKCW
jgi:hypothetical protein